MVAKARGRGWWPCEGDHPGGGLSVCGGVCLCSLRLLSMTRASGEMFLLVVDPKLLKMESDQSSGESIQLTCFLVLAGHVKEAESDGTGL